MNNILKANWHLNGQARKELESEMYGFKQMEVTQSGKSDVLERVKSGTPNMSLPVIHVFSFPSPLPFWPISLSHLLFPGTLLNYLHIFVTPSNGHEME